MPDDASALIAYATYVGVDGQNHLTRVPTASLEWVITAINHRTYYVKFDKNFAKKHLFTASKATDQVMAEAKKLWEASSKSAKAYWLAWGYWKSYPPEYIAQAQANVDAGKMDRQAGHRTVAEQATCATCGHPRAKHQTGSGAATPCKQGGPLAPCNCTPFIGTYGQKRAALGKPTANPLEGMPSAVSTYVIMNKVAKSDFETVVTNAIIGGEVGGWAANACKDLDWDFGAARRGCVVTFDSATKATAQYQGIKVGVKNVTNDPNRPTYQVYHYAGVI